MSSRIWADSDLERQVAVATRQLATLIQAGIGIIEALEILARQSDSPRLRATWEDLTRRICEGSSLSAALTLHPQLFGPTYLGLIRAGEQTGRLHLVLQRLAEMLEKDFRLRRKLKSALVYPALVLATTGLLTFFLFTTVMPNFVTIFQEMGVPLPLLTQILVLLTRLCNHPGFWLVLLGSGYQAYLGFETLQSSRDGRSKLQRAALALPWLGRAIQDCGLARYCLTLENLLACGMGLPQALLMAAEASGQVALQEDAMEALVALESGLLLSEHYRSRETLYPGMMVHLITVGEESSSLCGVLHKLGEWFGEEADHRLEQAQAALEPVLMGLASLLVGLVILGIFLPLYGYLGRLGG